MSIQVETGRVRTQLMRSLVINGNLHSLAVAIDGPVCRDMHRFGPVRYWSDDRLAEYNRLLGVPPEPPDCPPIDPAR